MSFPIFGLILLSSLAWSLFDTSRKHLSSHLSASAAVVWLMLLQAPLFILLSVGEAWHWPEAGYWLPAAASLILNLLANIWFIESVRLAPLSLAIPILSLTPVFSAIGGFLALGEMTTARQALGITIIVAATFLLGRYSSALAKSENDVRVRRGLMLMALVAALWATTPVLDKICLRMVPASEHAFGQCLGIALAVAAFLRLRGQSLEARGAMKSRVWLLAAVAFAAAALITQFWAIRYVPVGMFEALKRAGGLVAALLLGLVVFHEPITKAKIASVVAIGVGIAILLL